MTQFNSIVLLGVALCTLSVSAQHSHDDAANSSDLTFVEMMRSLQMQLDILTRSVITDDFATAHDAAFAITSHQGPSAEALEIVMKVLKEKFERFEVCDAKVHDLAMKVAISAHQKDGDAMVDNYTGLVKQIRLCHLDFRNIVKQSK